MNQISLKRAALVGIFLGVVVGIVCGLLYLVYAHQGLGNYKISDFIDAVEAANEDELSIALMVFVATMLGMMAAAIIPNLSSKRKIHGNASFARLDQLKNDGWYWRGQGGKLTNLRLLGKFGTPKSKKEFLAITPKNDDQYPNICVISPPGGGKTTGIIIPQLLTYEGSIICLDVKGELWDRTANYRLSKKSRVFRFDPFNPDMSNSFNPLDGLEKMDWDSAYDELGRIGEALMEENDSTRPWRAGAINLFQAAGMLSLEQGNNNIGMIYDIVAGQRYQDKALEVKYELARKAFMALAVMDSRQRSSTVSVLRDSGLLAWSSPKLREITSKSDFSLEYLREINSTIYFVTKQSDIARLAPLIRVFFQLAMYRMTNSQWDETKHKSRVLFLMDEFETLGQMPVLVDSLKTLRGAGGRIVTVTQNLSQLKNTYGHDNANAILSLSGVQVYGATNDPEILSYIPKVTGEFTNKSKSHNRSIGVAGDMFDGTVTTREEAVSLINVDDIAQMPMNKFLIIRTGAEPTFVEKIRYFEDPLFEGLDRTPNPVGRPIWEYMKDHPNMPIEIVNEPKKDPSLKAFEEIGDDGAFSLMRKIEAIAEMADPSLEDGIIGEGINNDGSIYIPPKLRTKDFQTV